MRELRRFLWRPPRRGVPAGRAAVGGHVLLGMVVLLGVLSAVQWSQQATASAARDRDREAQLQFVGEQYRRALQSYARATPPGQSRLPTRLEQLLDDRRGPVPQQHVRQLWPDPFTGKADWELIKAGDRILGLHSRSERELWRVAAIDRGTGGPAPRLRARDLRFVADGAFAP